MDGDKRQGQHCEIETAHGDLHTEVVIAQVRNARCDQGTKAYLMRASLPRRSHFV